MKNGEIIHVAPPAHLVPQQMNDLFIWLRDSNDHLLIRSCVSHYEFEFIHPFPDGNGRIGRLWQSLILAKWNPLFLQLPVEIMVYHNQARYYQAINDSSAANDSGIFIDFMLREILDALREHESSRRGITNSADEVFLCIQDNPGIRTGMLAEKLSISRRTAERLLQVLKKAGTIEFRGAPRNGGYYPK
jgi:Fic family protein